MPTGLGLYTSDQHESKLWRWIGIAAILHVLFVGVIALLLTILMFLGWDIPLFKAHMQTPDVEFVLVENTPTQKPLHPTRNRAEHDSRSGGKKVANRPVQMPQQMAGAPSRKSTPRPSVAPQAKANPAPQPRPAQQVAQWQAPTPARQPSTTPRPTPTPAPTPPAPKVPQPRKIAQASPSLPPNPIAPRIRTPAPPNPTFNGGPVVKTPGASGDSGSSSGASGNPGPSMIAGNPSRGGAGSPGMAGRTGGSGGGGGHGSYNQSGSPGGGGGADDIDAMAEPDFGPYIAELQRRIRRNWAPPVEDRSKRVVALFKISRDGRLISLRIQQSSGSPAADQAAMAAVKASAPFRNLPPNYRGNDIDVQFIFDYEIYGGGSAQRR